MLLEVALGLMLGSVGCHYGDDMDNSDYARTVQQHGQAGQYMVDNYGKTAAQGCVNGGTVGAISTGTMQGAIGGCALGACGNVAQNAVWPEKK